MSSNLPAISTPVKKTPRAAKPQLRVVIDTNALYVTPSNLGSASDLVRHEIANVIVEAKYPDLDLFWYIPEIVRHERQYQMQTEALKLRPAINRIERLLGHNLALTDQILLDRVKTKIEEKDQQLGLQEIKLDHNLVEWAEMIQAAAYRHPPFEAGDKEKGFRDALVAESFLQLLAASPKTANRCRVVLVTSDVLLTQAVNARIADSPNASILANVEELKGLINTIVSNVGEDFIAQIKPKAAKLFFISSEDKETVFYKEKIRERLREKFKSELEIKPPGAAFRQNGTWRIETPNFSRKEGRRVFWTSRITIELEAGTVTDEAGQNQISLLSDLLLAPAPTGTPPQKRTISAFRLSDFTAPINVATDWPGSPKSIPTSYQTSYSPQPRVATHRGTDIFEVRWSTEVTISKELKKAAIEDIAHVELTYLPIS